MRAQGDGAAPGPGLGLDLGSTALRVAFGPPGGPVRRFALAGGQWPGLLCEPAVAGPLPVAFTSLKSRLGSGRPVRVDGMSVPPEDVLAGVLRVVRERVEDASGARIGQTVVSVPVSYRSTQRTALLEAARAAGLSEVRLIGDAMAAVVGYTEGRGSSTCLVYGLGYQGFELGLVRGARERYRALGHESATGTGGRVFDDAGLTAALRAVRGRPLAPDPDDAWWLRLRERVARVREDLGAPGGGAGGLLEIDCGDGGTVQLGFDLVRLTTYLERHARRTLDRARTLLDQSAMTARDVDTLLLVGGGTRLAAVGAAVRGLGREIVRAPDDLLAHGALVHAAQLAGAPPGGIEGLAPTAAATGDDTLADAPRLSVTLLPPAPPPAPDPPDPRDPGYRGGAGDPGDTGYQGASRDVSGSREPGGAGRRGRSPETAGLDVARARKLAGDGRVEEARALLEAILAEAHRTLDDLRRSATAPPGEQPGTPHGPQSSAAVPDEQPDAPHRQQSTAPRPARRPDPPHRRQPPGERPDGPLDQPSAAVPPGRSGDDRPGALSAAWPATGPPAGSAARPDGRAAAPPSDAEHWADRRAARRLRAARELLLEGRWENAVEAAHAAWQAAGGGTLGAAVLDAMIDVHCAAAMADSSPEHFPDAERWLLCAYGHDPTNARVRELLAERTYRHAERLDGRGRYEDAVEVLRRCLNWNPEHPSARALLERLNRRGRNQQDRGGVPR
ncbi:Hsp70 family protein [Streptomyces sp. NPDC005840]|uniref:Hsp70 family protein n=1 Tax=Streptomyces sp. NPDC005840 TaxID=3157072 RepID=UPI0033C7D13E